MRKRLRNIFILLAALTFSYSRWIETRWIEITRHEVQLSAHSATHSAAHSEKLISQITIAHLTDLHIVDFGPREKKLIELLNEEKPDVIVITGDTVTKNKNWAEVEQVLKALSDLQTKYGVYAVRGNWEHWADTPVEEFAAFQKAGVTLLENANRQIAQGIWLAGFDDYLTGTIDLEKAFQGVPTPQNETIIGLFHTPVFYDQIKDRVSVAMAGHTHAGQFRIPGLRPLYLPPGSWPYVEGWYDQHKFYVSRGIGNSGLNMRFACRPELAIHKLSISPQRK